MTKAQASSRARFWAQAQARLEELAEANEAHHNICQLIRILTLLAMACDVPGASILAPVPGFVMYAMSAQLQGLQFIGVPLRSDFELDLPAMLLAIAEHKPSITYLAYPNNPTAKGAFSVVCDATNNSASRVALGYLQADVKVKYLNTVRFFLVNMEGGGAVTVTSS